jgi:antitoxin (DNA-binding transcriptional repressor) of toxin-antitoxin stability system
MGSTKVGIREFRENLSSFLESSKPVAITRHGETVGFYIPAKRKRKQADLEALRAAGQQIDTMLAAAGMTEDELVRDFTKLRRQPHRTER